MPENIRMKICSIGGVGFAAVKYIIDNRLMSKVDCITAFTGPGDHSEIPSGILCHRLDAPIGLGRKSVSCRIEHCEKDKGLIGDKILNNDLMLFIGPCGGSAGSAIYATLAKRAKEMKITTVSFGIRPFVFEGRHRAQNFADGLELAKMYSDATFVCSLNELIDDYSGEHMNMLEAFAYADRKIAHCVTALFHALSQSKDLLNNREKLVEACQTALSADPVAKSAALEIY